MLVLVVVGLLIMILIDCIGCECGCFVGLVEWNSFEVVV